MLFRHLFKNPSVIQTYYVQCYCWHVFKVWSPKAAFKSLGSTSDVRIRFGERVQKFAFQISLDWTSCTLKFGLVTLQISELVWIISSLIMEWQLQFITRTQRWFLKLLECLLIKIITKVLELNAFWMELKDYLHCILSRTINLPE